MEKENKFDQHVIDDLCDCLIMAFVKVPLDRSLCMNKIRAEIEVQIRARQNLSPWIKELIKFEDERVTKH